MTKKKKAPKAKYYQVVFAQAFGGAPMPDVYLRKPITFSATSEEEAIARAIEEIKAYDKKEQEEDIETWAEAFEVRGVKPPNGSGSVIPPSIWKEGDEPSPEGYQFKLYSL